MDFGLGTFALGYLAGVLSTLSPCVLPLVPILLATAIGAHRRGPLALALGLALSFAVVGIFLATIGASLGLEGSTFRNVAAVILIAFAIVLLSTRLQERFAVATVMRVRGRMMSAGRTGKMVGHFLLAVGWPSLLVWTSASSAWVVDISPAWLTELTTRF